MTAVGLEPNITAVKGQCHYPLDQAAILCGLITHTVADILFFLMILLLAETSLWLIWLPNLN